MRTAGADPLEAPEEPSSFRLIATMGVAGLLAGLLLVGVYIVTKPLIAENQYNDLQEAIRQVLPGVHTTKTWVLRDGALAPYEGPEGELPKEEAVYSGVDQAGARIGFAVVTEGPGFQETVKVLYGFDPSRQVIVGMAVLESKETPGLGDKIIFDDNFHACFEALAIEPPIVTVRDGRDAPNEVDVISGATISADAVVSMINKSTKRWAPILTSASQSSEGGP